MKAIVSSSSACRSGKDDIIFRKNPASHSPGKGNNKAKHSSPCQSNQITFHLAFRFGYWLKDSLV